MKFKRILTLFSIASFFFVVNPYWGCTPEEQFQFGEKEMQQVILGSWVGTIELKGKTVHFEMELEQGILGKQSNPLTTGIIRSSLCGSRSFLRTAGACIAVSIMNLKGRLTTEDGTYDEDVEGRFEVYGATLKGGSLSFKLKDKRQMFFQFDTKLAPKKGNTRLEQKQGVATLKRKP